MTQTIIPRFKLLITFDIKQATHEAYFQFVLGELVPAMQGMGLYMLQAYHTAYGHYPLRQLEFVAEDFETVRKAMQTDTWAQIQAKFNDYTTNYGQKVVRFKDGFQF